MKPPREPGLVLKQAGLAQAAALGALQARCWQAAYKGLLPPRFLRTFTPARRRAVMRRTMETQPAAEYYLAYVDGRRAGFLVVNTARDDDVPGAGEVTAIYLLPGYWGGGYGGQMLRFALERLDALGYQFVILWTLADNRRARLFYEHMGFVANGLQRHEDFGGETRLCVRYRRGLGG